ncbi:DUF6693 family protein [Burkholderia vietnamiensis]|uniref:DUF6693 family protein n=1 Tax=Burkholderia vietnamiensis TaxID=60552 RepID=UPI000759CA50|nr:DUF6693 family protein [Burkholderia vietnamiensis]KVF22131.1 hypothetical protein WJ07_17840 [Burkholderia vietnamiensis]KVF62696.1 hypothetical protein WJ17_29435 [Burkholderia vietnamiensis]
MNNLTLKFEPTVSDIIGHAVIWILLSIATVGFAFFAYPYYMYRFVMSRTIAKNSNGKVIGRLECAIDLATSIGKIVVWPLISTVTLGVGYAIFLYKIFPHCMNHIRVVSNG